GSENVFIVSKVGKGWEADTKNWIDTHILRKTDFREQHVFFCAQRSEKAPICQDLELTYFVDNRMDVLLHLPFIPHLYLFQPSPSEVESITANRPKVEYTADTWPDLVSHIEKTLT